MTQVQPTPTPSLNDNWALPTPRPVNTLAPNLGFNLPTTGAVLIAEEAVNNYRLLDPTIGGTIHVFDVVYLTVAIFIVLGFIRKYVKKFEDETILPAVRQLRQRSRVFSAIAPLDPTAPQRDRYGRFKKRGFK